MAHLMNAPSVIPQLILYLCTISIATCNKVLNQIAPFNGDKVRPRITAKAGGQTFSWLFDTGASITCMTVQSFHAAFPHSKPRKVQNSQHCTATSGNKMNSLGIYEIDLQIKGKKFTHQSNVIDKLTDNIIGIDFMHKHKLHYDDCKLVIDNCAPYNITIDRNDVIGLMDIETEQLQPLEDSVQC